MPGTWLMIGHLLEQEIDTVVSHSKYVYDSGQINRPKIHFVELNNDSDDTNSQHSKNSSLR